MQTADVRCAACNQHMTDFYSCAVQTVRRASTLRYSHVACDLVWMPKNGFFFCSGLCLTD